MEIFSQNKFLEIGEEKYNFTLGPYGYYWFLMEKREDVNDAPLERAINDLEVEIEWEHFFDNYTAKRAFEKKILPNYMRSCRWFGGKSKNIVSIDVIRFPALDVEGRTAFLAQVELRYTDGLPETYSLPLAFVTNAEKIVHYLKNAPNGVLCYLKTPEKEGIIIDALFNEAFCNELFWQIKNNNSIAVTSGRLRFESGKMLSELDIEKEDISSEVLKVEQSNTSVIYNDQFFFKIYRKLDVDINPDLELVRFLSDKTSFENSPRYGGGIQYQETNEKSYIILGLLQNKIPNQGEAWTSMLEELNRYYEKVLTKIERSKPLPKLVTKDRLYFKNIPDQIQKLIGSVTYERVVLLAQRTAEMHIALASREDDPDFCPERFTQNYQRSIYSGHRKLVNEKLTALSYRLENLPEHIAAEAQQVLDIQEDIMESFKEIYSQKIDAYKTRIHGDYHLGQVLFNGRDFYIIDFEGEPMHSISERRLKKTPLKDVAGMIRSFHYAAYGQLVLNQNYRKEDMPFLEQWANQWFHYINQVYLTAYLDRAKGAQFLPSDEKEMKLLLRNYILEKAIYEVGYEMNARPDWLRIPIRGVLYAMRDQ